MNPNDSRVEDLNSELENFRQQWLYDLRSKNEAAGHSHQPGESSSSTQPTHPSGPSVSTSTKRRPTHADDDDDYFQGRSFDEPPVPAGHTLAGPGKPAPKKLVSALDYFEEAMEREAQGNMGDSLKLYRRAYKVFESTSYRDS